MEKEIHRGNAMHWIVEAIMRYERNHSDRVSVVQVGSKMFAAAYPGEENPQTLGHVGIFPRPDICGDWAIVIPKVKDATAS